MDSFYLSVMAISFVLAEKGWRETLRDKFVWVLVIGQAFLIGSDHNLFEGIPDDYLIPIFILSVFILAIAHFMEGAEKRKQERLNKN